MKPVRLRLARYHDMLWIWRVRNYPSVREQMADPGRISLADHIRWFISVRSIPWTVLYVAKCGARRVGVGRLDFDREKTATVDIYVHPKYQGQGVGTQLIRALVRKARYYYGTEVLYAKVREGNAASRRLFAGAGFDRDDLSRYSPGYVLMKLEVGGDIDMMAVPANKEAHI